MAQLVDKPVRVQDAEVLLFGCPLCEQVVTGVVEVATYIDGVTVDSAPAGQILPVAARARTDVRTVIRRLEVHHICNGQSAQ